MERVAYHRSPDEPWKRANTTPQMSFMRSKMTRIEDKVRRKLKKEPGSPFREVGLLVGGKLHKFDIVSHDRQTIGEIKSTVYPASGKSLDTKVGDMSSDILLLLGRRARRKMLDLTDKGFYDWFVKTPQAKVATKKGIEIILDP